MRNNHLIIARTDFADQINFFLSGKKSNLHQIKNTTIADNLMDLPTLNLPHSDHQIDAGQIFDPIRKKWVALTPEEWVRQNFIAYLLKEKGCPRSLIKIENTIQAFGASRRCDAVVYSNEIHPLLIIECKAPTITINEKTFRQIALYNSVLQTPYLIVTNGLDHYCLKINLQTGKYRFLKDIPSYAALQN